MKRFCSILAVMFLLSCSDQQITYHEVHYDVSGTAASADITYATTDGGTAQVAAATLPWSTGFGAQPGTFLYLSAQNTGSTGDITVQIIVNGAPWKSSTSSGAYVIATASGTL